jgi:hypothetical protein
MPRVLAVLAAVLVVGVAPAHAHVVGDSRERQTVEVPRPFALPAQAPAEPPIVATPPARCNAGSRPEPSIQGRLPREEVDSGRADEGYWCNLTVLGRSGNTGGFRVHRYIDQAGHECAYYDTALLFPTNALSFSAEPTGVAVLDMSDPRKPVRTETLITPAMQTPHESVNISVQRGILAAVMGNPAQYPGGVDVYDISKDCRHPQPMAAAFPATPFGHESGMAPDGLTFYPTSPGTSHMSAVDISNPQLPRTLVTSQFNTHGMSVSDDGRRGYLATLDGLVIVDLSEVQERKPNPQVREISRLVWSNMTIPQVAIPVTINGKPYVVEVDEFSTTANGDITGNGERVGAARIIDVSDETKPRVVSNIRLAVHQPENRAALANDYGAQSPVQGYAGHYCNVPQRNEPGIFACSMIASGLRVFDIRDPEKPREIAYFMSPPSTISQTGGPVIDERSNWAMAQPAFAPERGEIWYSDGNSGFYALQMDPQVWPFGTSRGADGCVDNRGLASVSAKAVRDGGVRLSFQRRVALPVRVDIFRVSEGRRVVEERRVASFTDRRSSFTWRGARGRGYYFARFTMREGGRVYDTQRIVLRRTRSGFKQRPEHYRRDSCSLLRRFKLERPVFGGSREMPLRGAYRVTAPATVSIVVTRGKRIVKRFAAATRAPGRTFRFSLPAHGLARGDYRVQLRAVSGEDQVSATLTAHRL